MKIEIKKEHRMEFEVGDVIENLESGLLYLLVKNDRDEYGWVDLKRGRMSIHNFTSIDAVVISIYGNHILHKSDDVKLTIE